MEHGGCLKGFVACFNGPVSCLVCSPSLPQPDSVLSRSTQSWSGQATWMDITHLTTLLF
ncbi:X-ray repair complementing defective repair in Chinese hamster cells 6, isoform CRA_b [Rattus norvegicus]|uniref:X-ray repair complementing defective repair in Chinese hamster cells 6, isoform CRA_b n=1 Tax=Rattus norvegicus TaxID=10116 RepID=A6HT42_RAT|nr:X-ray repair complementing defective repair in Chinese hamster cells 6, isoform CRA_b [Rattus norvegicus]